MSDLMAELFGPRRLPQLTLMQAFERICPRAYKEILSRVDPENVGRGWARHRVSNVLRPYLQSKGLIILIPRTVSMASRDYRCLPKEYGEIKGTTSYFKTPKLAVEYFQKAGFLDANHEEVIK